MKNHGTGLRSPRLRTGALAALVVLAAAAPRSDAQPTGEDRSKHRWELLVSSEPPRRDPFSEGVGVYDPFHRQFIIHEGAANEIAALSVDDGIWREVRLSTIGPTSRASHAAVFDVKRRAMVVFGGSGGFGGRLADVWAFDTRRRDWVRLDDPKAARKPATRSNSTMVLDTLRDRLLVYGGVSGTGSSTGTEGDVWEFDLETRAWREIVPGVALPMARLAHAAVYDRLRDRMLVFGGQNFENGVVTNLNDLWAFDCATETWSEVMASGPDAPPALLDTTFMTDGEHRAFIVGGGSGTVPIRYTKDVRVLDLRTDTWRLVPDLNDGGDQQPGGGPGLPPGWVPRSLHPISHHVAVFVPGDAQALAPVNRGPRICVFGGSIQLSDNSLEFRVDTWIYKRQTRLFHN